MCLQGQGQQWGGSHDQLQAHTDFSLHSTLAVPSPPGPQAGLSLGKASPPPGDWGLGAGWATFWFVFTQIPFLPCPRAAGGSHAVEDRGEAEVFICPPPSQAKKNSPLPRSFISSFTLADVFCNINKKQRMLGRRGGWEEKEG